MVKKLATNQWPKGGPLPTSTKVRVMHNHKYFVIIHYKQIQNLNPDNSMVAELNDGLRICIGWKNIHAQYGSYKVYNKIKKLKMQNRHLPICGTQYTFGHYPGFQFPPSLPLPLLSLTQHTTTVLIPNEVLVDNFWNKNFPTDICISKFGSKIYTNTAIWTWPGDRRMTYWIKSIMIQAIWEIIPLLYSPSPHK